jgi:hypothetical protein
MACGQSGLNMNINIGNASAAVHAFIYGGATYVATVTVNGAVTNIPLSGTADVCVDGVWLKFTFSYAVDDLGAFSYTVTCKIRDVFNICGSPYTDQTKDFISLSNISVSGSDECTVTNNLSVTLPVIMEVLT